VPRSLPGERGFFVATKLHCLRAPGRAAGSQARQLSAGISSAQKMQSAFIGSKCTLPTKQRFCSTSGEKYVFVLNREFRKFLVPTFVGAWAGSVHTYA
jgi:hypothetical protein